MPTTYVRANSMQREFRHAPERISYQPPLRENQVLLYSRPVLMEGTKNFQRENLSGIQVSLPKLKVFTFTVLRNLVKVPPTIFKSTNFKIKNKTRLC